MIKVEAEYRILHRIADRLAPDMKQAFLEAVRALRAKIDPTQLQALLARGDQGDLGAFWQTFEQEVGPTLRQPISDATLRAGQRTGNALGMAFDITNPRARQAIDRQSLTLIHDITQESRAAIRAILREGFNGGIDVPEMARRIRGSIGLNERGATAVENFRRAQLEQGIDPDVVEERALSYAQRLLRQRATNIARTETIAAANQGQQAAWEEAQAQGYLGAAMRTWITTPDDRLCEEICAPMDGQVRGINEPFTTGEGDLVMLPPAHPSCRCAVGLAVPEEA